MRDPDSAMTAAPSGAVIEDCYRYLLWRTYLVGTGTVVFIMLNPSTADDRELDPTCRRCQNFAHDWGFRRLEVVNLYALRSTDPAALRTHQEPVGPKNDEWIEHTCARADLVVAAWGGDRVAADRSLAVADMLAKAGITVHCLGTTKDGAPRHPLYVKGDTKPERWDRPITNEPEDPAP